MPRSVRHHGLILPAAFAALAIGALAGAAPAAEPEPCAACAPRAELQHCLEQRFGERVRVVAASRAGWPLEILVSDDRTWTVIVTRPDGLACVGGYGTEWREERGSDMSDGNAAANGARRESSAVMVGQPAAAPVRISFHFR